MYGNNYGDATYRAILQVRHQKLLTMFVLISATKVWNKNYKCKNYFNFFYNPAWIISRSGAVHS